MSPHQKRHFCKIKAFENETFSCHFVQNHLKTGLFGLVFECHTKSGPYKTRPDGCHSKSDVRISDPTVIASLNRILFQHAMNLAVSNQSHVAAAVAAVNNAATTLDTSALLYQQNDHHQQQPISYKIPQVKAEIQQCSTTTVFSSCRVFQWQISGLRRRYIGDP